MTERAAEPDGPEPYGSANWITVALEEYRAIRDEIIKSIEVQQMVLNFALGAVSVLLLAAFNVDVPGVTVALLILVVPTMAGLAVLMWLSEVARMMRAGLFLHTAERKINTRFEDAPLSWEKWAHGRDERPPELDCLPDVEGLQFKLVIPAFGLLAVASIAIGAALAFAEYDAGGSSGFLVVVGALVGVAAISFVGRTVQKTVIQVREMRTLY